MVSQRSSATSRTKTAQDFTFNNVDNAVSDGMPGGAKINFNLANSKSEGISIVNTDQGAISAARDIIISSIDAGSNKFEQAISAIQGTNKDAIKAVTRFQPGCVLKFIFSIYENSSRGNTGDRRGYVTGEKIKCRRFVITNSI